MEFYEVINNLVKEKEFNSFDSFIIKEMGFDWDSITNEEQKEKVRYEAFHIFRKSTNQKNFASLPTMRRWFGISGKAKPSREIVYEICFEMNLDKEKAKEYLTKGIGEPSFQVNDYQEIIYLYGIENGISFKQCLKMIEMFEKNMDREIIFQKTHTTKELTEQFEIVKNANSQEFILWMIDRADWFKGYSYTTLNYLAKMRANIMEGIREDSKKLLENLLQETNYKKWSSKHGRGRDEYKKIRKYVKSLGSDKDFNVSENLGESILELARLVYSEKEANSRLLSEIYSSPESKISSKKKERTTEICGMTGKYLSDLFNIPTKKEQKIRVSQMMRELNEYQPNDKCPEWIQKLGNMYTKGKGDFSTVSCAMEELKKYESENRRRCLLIQRGDILPMILNIAQRKYWEENEWEYKKDRARQIFIDLANVTLNACNMAKLNEEYELDAVLLACYQEKEMFSYSDVLDVIYERGEEI